MCCKGLEAFHILGRLPDVYQFYFFTPECQLSACFLPGFALLPHGRGVANDCFAVAVNENTVFRVQWHPLIDAGAVLLVLDKVPNHPLDCGGSPVDAGRGQGRSHLARLVVNEQQVLTKLLYLLGSSWALWEHKKIEYPPLRAVSEQRSAIRRPYGWPCNSRMIRYPHGNMGWEA